MNSNVQFKAILIAYAALKDGFCYNCTGDCDDCEVGTIKEILCKLEKQYMRVH